MSSRTPPPQSPVPQFRVVQGKVFVPLFVVTVVTVAALAVWLSLRVRPVAVSARAKTFPLAAKLNVACRVAGKADEDVHATGRCGSSGKLVVRVEEAGTAAKYVGYAVVGEKPDEVALTGQFEAAQEQLLALDSRAVGPHTLVFFVAEKPVDLQEMKHALSLARPDDMGDKLLRLEQFRVVMRKAENDARIERLRFLVDPG